MPVQTDSEAFDALRFQLESMRAELASVRQDLATAGRLARSSLRTHLRCPECGGTTILHAPTVLDRADAGYREALAISQPSSWSTKGVGQFEVFVCQGCGLTEWYVKNPESLRADGKTIRKVEGTPGSSDPYR